MQQRLSAFFMDATIVGGLFTVTDDAMDCNISTTHQVLYNSTQTPDPKQATRHKTLLQGNKNHKTTPTPTTTQKKAAEDQTRTSHNTRHKNIPAHTTYKNNKKSTRLNYGILYRPRQTK